MKSNETAEVGQSKVPNWYKSHHSSTYDGCVEVSHEDGAVSVRDSKDHTGPVLRFTTYDWVRFIDRVKARR